MDPQPPVGKGLRQARGQAAVVGQRADQRHARVRHDPGPAADFQSLRQLLAVTRQVLLDLAG
jgi:hypothetical protein